MRRKTREMVFYFIIFFRVGDIPDVSVCLPTPLFPPILKANHGAVCQVKCGRL
jgi:hypothetical protein